MTVTTYPAIIRNGKVEPVAPLELPEGSEAHGAQKGHRVACGSRWESPYGR
jgi:hypothetical protein